MKKQRGFTLIELMAVMAILGILLTLGLNSYTNYLKRGRDAKRKADLEQIRTALEMYRSDLSVSGGKYPASTWTKIDGSSDTLSSTLISGGYMSSVPTDPRNTATNPGPCWNPSLYRYNYRSVDSEKGYLLTAMMEISSDKDSSPCDTLSYWVKSGCKNPLPTKDYCYGVQNP